MRGQDLQNMKHLCHGQISLSDLEKSTSPSALFQIMLQRRLISPGNLSHLDRLLDQIGRADLARKIQTSGNDTTMETESAVSSNPADKSYRAFLMKLSDELTRDNVDSLKFVADLPDGIDENVRSGKDLFKYMIQCGRIGPCNLDHLADMLQEIHRRDLAERVRKFQSDEAVSPGAAKTEWPAQSPINGQCPFAPTQAPPLRPLVTGKQPTMHQMGEPRPPSAPLLSPAYFLRGQGGSSDNVEPRFPVQAGASPAEIVAPMQQLGVDEEEAMPSYPMRNRPRGIALIISNERFEGNPDLRDRQGNQKDVNQLRELWQFLNFDVIVESQLESHEMYNVIRRISTMDHSNFDCFVCCLLSHGANGGIYGTDSVLVEIKYITAMFKGVACPSLANKPKLFFIQACRGQDFDRGARIEADAVESNPEDAMRNNAEPNESHFLLGYATPPGYVSWRSQVHGSWYISKLCEVFRKYCENYDVTTMMVKVNDEVSDAFTKRGYKQCPAPVVTLRKRIYLNNN